MPQQQPGIRTQADVYAAGAPVGYRFNPTTGQYERTPQAQGADTYAQSLAAKGPYASANDSSAASVGGAVKGLQNATFGNQAGGSGFQTAPQAQASRPVTLQSSMAGFNPSMFSAAAPQAGPAPPQVSTYTSPAPPPSEVGAIQTPDATASNAAAFARAKDQVGQTARGALTGLSGAMAGRGIVGSGVEGRGMVSAINQGQQTLGDVSREQAITGSTLANQNAVTGYQGAITQRGQNLAATQAANAQMLQARDQDIAQRGQDINSLSTTRQQDLTLADANSNRALQALLAQYQGNLTQRTY